MNSEYDEITNLLYSPSKMIFRSVMNGFFNDHTAIWYYYIETVVPFDENDSVHLKKICAERGLDAILLAKLYVVSKLPFYMTFIDNQPDTLQFWDYNEWDMIVEMKLFGSNGKLFAHISNNTTFGYFRSTTPTGAIYDGVHDGLTYLFSTLGGHERKKQHQQGLFDFSLH